MATKQAPRFDRPKEMSRNQRTSSPAHQRTEKGGLGEVRSCYRARPKIPVTRAYAETTRASISGSARFALAEVLEGWLQETGNVVPLLDLGWTHQEWEALAEFVARLNPAITTRNRRGEP